MEMHSCSAHYLGCVLSWLQTMSLHCNLGFQGYLPSPWHCWHRSGFFLHSGSFAQGLMTRIWEMTFDCQGGNVFLSENVIRCFCHLKVNLVKFLPHGLFEHCRVDLHRSTLRLYPGPWARSVKTRALLFLLPNTFLTLLTPSYKVLNFQDRSLIILMISSLNFCGFIEIFPRNKSLFNCNMYLSV